MEEALVALLLANAAVIAIATDRVFWGTRPQGSPLPAITLTRITGARDYTNDGASGLVASRVQIDCEAETYLASKTLARAAVAAMGGVPVTLAGCELQGAFVQGERDLFEFDAETSTATHPFGVTLDVVVHHSE